MNKQAQIEVIFFAALEITTDEKRIRYLDVACHGDAELRDQVEKLLRAHLQMGPFLNEPALHHLDVASTNDATQELQPKAPKKSKHAPPEPDHTVTSASNLTPAATDDDENDTSFAFLEASQRPDSLGRLGHYEVLQVLGKGGFGIVFRAFDDVLQRVVALKVMAPQIATTSPARKRFLREARSSAQVRHENVVQVYAVEEQPLPYLVMEFIPGETLQQRLNRTGPLDPLEIVRIGRQIAEGLAAAHATDLIHRDIKPGNILLEGGQHHVKITDFGLARAADDASISQSGVIAGTPMFMAPEQALGQALDQRADLFSLGSVLYQMVSGRPPFRANTTVAVLKRVAEDQPRPIHEIIPEAPTWLCNIIAKLHAKNPDERYQSAREVADIFADCEARLKAHQRIDSAIAVPNVPQTTPKATPNARLKWAYVIQLSLLLAVIACAIAYPLLNRDEPPLNPTTKPLVADERYGWPAEAPAFAIAPFDAQQAQELQVAWAKYLGVPARFENPQGVTFVLIPPGEFLMGTSIEASPELITSAGDDQNLELHVRSESPQHRVAVTKPFYLSTTEVTQAQYEAIIGRNPSYFAALGDGRDKVGMQPTGTFPVEQVAWTDAADFCTRMSLAHKLKPCYVHIDHTITPVPANGYRLPTEAEWEFAARAGVIATPSLKDYAGVLPQTGWFSANSGGQTHTVGTLQPNAFGLHDMEGNVWEWVQDWWQPTYDIAPDGQALRDPAGPPNGSLRSVRGGSWPNPPTCCRVAHRFSFAPNRWGFILGFRVALSVDGAKQLQQAPQPFPTLPDAERQRIAALPAAKQVEEVIKLLRQRNPGWNTEVKATIEGDHVVGIKVEPFQLADLTPLQSLPHLHSLDINAHNGRRGTLDNLAPLRGLKLSNLNCSNSPFTDLEPLRGMPLTHLYCDNSNISDLAPLTGMALKELNISYTNVTDLSPLKGSPLVILWMNHTKVSDLRPLVGMNTLRWLTFHSTSVTDVGPLKNLAVDRIYIDYQPQRDRQWLAGPHQLREINNTPAAEVLSEWGLGPVNNTTIAKLRMLPVAEQVEAVRDLLKTRNPGFDGTLTPTIQEDFVVGLNVSVQHLTDLTPLRAFKHLQTLTCVVPKGESSALSDLRPLNDLPLVVLDLRRTKVADLTPLIGTPLKKLDIVACPVSDLSPIKKMRLDDLTLVETEIKHLRDLEGTALTHFTVMGSPITDLSPLKGMKLRELTLHNTPVADLTPVKDAPLELLNIERTNIADLTPLRGSKLRVLIIKETKVTDLRPLQDVPLQQIILDYQPARDAAILRHIKTLEDINNKPAREVLKD